MSFETILTPFTFSTGMLQRGYPGEGERSTAIGSALSCTRLLSGHSNRQVANIISMWMTITHYVTNYLDPREALDKQTQCLFEFNERCRTTDAGMMPETKVEDGSWVLPVDAERTGILEYGRIVVGANDRGI